jgi:hypothetical protein
MATKQHAQKSSLRRGPPKRQPPRKRRVSKGATARRAALAALAKESDRQLDELIARRLALPIEQRMNFLRRRLPGGGSCL